MKLIFVAALLILNVSQSFHMEMNDEDGNGFNSLSTTIDRPAQFEERTGHRAKRGIWDFFQKMVITKNLIVEQYTDTRDTLNEVYNMFNSQFSDPAPSKPTPRSTSTEAPKTSSEDSTDSSEVKTTTERYQISRYELGRILGRNFRGLKRLAQIEFQDAFNATKYNLAEYREEASKQFANSLAAEKKKQLKALVKG
ncbi:uncharacterized protein LOC101887631 [Musca domestica]|uniref:Uncharacterized protein LOC101887631 n=1 Tax=Musca domestica TaxID=7370 RepID=A0A1I8MBD0_MUSDO|nr:uncharacterized protein LOC101887631 [Musca domestica]